MEISIKVTDKKLASKINKATKIDKEIKELKTKLEAIKENMYDVAPGKYITDKGNTVTIAEAPKFSEISPEKVKKELRSKRLGKKFTECIKVVITPLKKYLSDQEIKDLREIESYTRRYSFK
jgi:hypothetical protein